jgi:short-subunit dehydrogenase
MISAERYGPWAVVTGGSEGTGAAYARALATAGVNLVLIARREGPLRETAEAIRAATGVEVRTLPLDLSRPDMLDQIRAATDELEVGLLVSNVGHTYGGGPFVEMELDDALQTIRLNPMCHAALSHHFGRKMAARGRGGIVLVGSLAGNAGGATMVMYSAGKAFTQVFAEGLWAELQPKGVDVVYVVLGATDTPARARQGFDDSPDTFIDDPDDVARDTFEQITQGPVLVRPQLEEAFKMFSSMPRRQAAEAMRDLLGGFQPAEG